MHKLSASDSAEFAESARVVMRSYLSTNHLYAARYSAEAAQKREDALKVSRPAFDMRHRGLVLAAVMESVAFLEAAINEIFQDAADEQHSYVGGLSPHCLKLMKALWAATNEGYIDTLDKYDLALEFAGNDAFDQSINPYQAARLVIRLRNYLVHYKPHDTAVNIEHKFGKALRGKFPMNELMADSDNPWFLDQALGAGCAQWAWRSARALTDMFGARIGIRLNYQLADFGDPLPS